MSRSVSAETVKPVRHRGLVYFTLTENQVQQLPDKFGIIKKVTVVNLWCEMADRDGSWSAVNFIELVNFLVSIRELLE